MAVADDSGWAAVAIGDTILQTDNMDALNRYMTTTPVKTKKAGELQRKWVTWWAGLGWYDKAVDSDMFDVARNKKREFDLANAETAAAKKAVEEAAKSGLTYEETLGQARASDYTGHYTTDADERRAEKEAEEERRELEGEPEPWLPTKTKVAIGVVGAVTLALYMAKKVYLDPLLAFVPGKG